MTKLQFLCINHRRWIMDNPEVSSRTWMQAYSRSLELLDEREYSQAASHAGAAFETADIMLAQCSTPNPVDIRRFCDSGLLLVQLLYLLQESQLAGTVMTSALTRLEGLLATGSDRRAVLAGCQRLQLCLEDLPRSEEHAKARSAARPAAASLRVH